MILPNTSQHYYDIQTFELYPETVYLMLSYSDNKIKDHDSSSPGKKNSSDKVNIYFICHLFIVSSLKGSFFNKTQQQLIKNSSKILIPFK